MTSVLTKKPINDSSSPGAIGDRRADQNVAPFGVAKQECGKRCEDGHEQRGPAFLADLFE
jgi:hypothetical protein